jgi:hypothetical protein
VAGARAGQADRHTRPTTSPPQRRTPPAGSPPIRPDGRPRSGQAALDCDRDTQILLIWALPWPFAKPPRDPHRVGDQYAPTRRPRRTDREPRTFISPAEGGTPIGASGAGRDLSEGMQIDRSGARGRSDGSVSSPRRVRSREISATRARKSSGSACRRDLRGTINRRFHA